MMLAWIRTLIITCLLYAPLCAGFDIIAHRGASGYLPEHTLAAATLAHSQRPDFIEQDVVMTKDHIPVVLHDIQLQDVTNVEQVFPDRHRADQHFYAIDFTLAELRRLSIHERHNSQGEAVFSQRYQGDSAGFRIATLTEHIELIAELNRQFAVNVGLYVEIKAPAWHRRQGVDISARVVALIQQQVDPKMPVVLQCFDFAETQRIRTTLEYKGQLIQLVGENSWNESNTDYQWLISDAGLKEVAEVADGLGPWLPQLYELTSSKTLNVPDWVYRAHEHGLLLHPYTYRQDALPDNLSGTRLIRYLQHTARVQGLFTDQVPAVKARLSNKANN
ncbi:glycerophosphodiester phosphodiesterase [Alteromonas lipotrueiana]|uniref:glycerophosphodiester phosphodiesterase n=1 Tax=Alteromonas lipotrueiana TaxID=2803815 RepID=UPI001FE98878|nr:glycerophosphodiester phosphodiesterase [Alteromonas lipotrueiana]